MRLSRHPEPFIKHLKTWLILSLFAIAPLGARGADHSAQIVDYLLGKSSNATGLDVNGDSVVDIADLVFAISHRAPVVTSFALAGGSASTGSRTVTLNNTCTGTPKNYMASESVSFSGGAWQAWSAAPSFMLSAGNAVKTVYFKVQDANGMESAVTSDTITLDEIVPLTVGAPATGGNISPAGDIEYYQFTVAAASTYVVETFPGTLTDDYLRLYGPNNQTTLLAQDHNSSANQMARVALMLAPGTYTVRTQAFSASATGTYSIRVTNIGALQATQFAINGGAAMTTNRAVTLNNTCTGAPKWYMASESASFSGAAWTAYAAAPSFTLSAGNVTKTVYFKVKDAGGMESPIASDTITLAETTALTVGAAAVTGNIAPAGEADWFQFTAPATSTYVIETWPGTLADPDMSLYGPGDMTTLVASDNDSGTGSAAKIARTLAPGTYTVRIQAHDGAAAGNYTIRVTDIGALKVSQFSINNGDSLTTTRTVTLNNTSAGAPTQYKASESSSFSGASWTAYDAAPSFTLSAGNGQKKVYFKVRDASGTESPVVSDTITLKEMVPLPSDGTTVGGNIGKADEEDWYLITISASGLYNIQTYAGSLSDTYLGLTATPTPSSSDWLAENDNISDSDLTSELTVWLDPGTYYARVLGPNSLTGSYNIRLDQVGNKALTVNGSTVKGNIASDTDVDWYRFTVGTSGLYAIETTADTLQNGHMELYGATAGMIATSDDISGTYSGTMPIISAYLTAGTYLIRFVGASSDDIGTYDISVSNGSAGAGSVALVINGATGSGSLKLATVDAFDTDWYQFVVSKEGSYTIQTTAGTLTNGYMQLMDSKGNVGMTSTNQSGMPTFSNVDLLPGVYYVYVEPLDVTDSGSYKIKIKD